jgi:hypothetical protein
VGAAKFQQQPCQVRPHLYVAVLVARCCAETQHTEAGVLLSHILHNLCSGCVPDSPAKNEQRANMLMVWQGKTVMMWMLLTCIAPV